MTASIFDIIKSTPSITALIGVPPHCRFWPWSEAPQEGKQVPYATHGVYNGIPANTMDKLPEVDNKGTQVDVWAATAASCKELATLIRDTLEPYGHMTAFDDSVRDPETKLFRIHMDFDFFVDR